MIRSYRAMPHSNMWSRQGELSGKLTSKEYANQQPSLGRNPFEGSETRIYRPERSMKSIGYPSGSRSALHPTQ